MVCAGWVVLKGLRLGWVDGAVEGALAGAEAGLPVGAGLVVVSASSMADSRPRLIATSAILALILFLSPGAAGQRRPLLYPLPRPEHPEAVPVATRPRPTRPLL